MSRAPVEFAWTNLKSVAEIIRGVTYKKMDARSAPGSELVPLLRATNIGSALDLTGALVYVPRSGVKSQQILRRGDIVLASSSGSLSVVGKNAVLLTDWNGTFGAFCAVVRPGPLVNANFLALYLSSEPVRQRWSEAARGTNINNLKKSDLEPTPIPLPPLEEQRRIVDILEDHLSRLDAANCYLDTTAQKSHVLYRGLLEAAMSGRLSTPASASPDRNQQLELRSALCPTGMKRGRPDPLPASEQVAGWPEHWVQVSLEEATHPVRTISYGILKPGPNIEGGVPYVRVLNMRNDVLRLGDLHRTTPNIAAQYSRASLVDGDLLISIRGTYGRVVMVPHSLDGGNITQDTARLAFVGPIDPAFARVYLQSPHAQGFLKRVARGVAVKGVNIGDLRTMPFPIPPLSEQQEIVMRVAELASEVESARRTAEFARTRSAVLRRSLLDAAFSGRLTGRSSDMALVEELAAT